MPRFSALDKGSSKPRVLRPVRCRCLHGKRVGGVWTAEPNSAFQKMSSATAHEDATLSGEGRENRCNCPQPGHTHPLRSAVPSGHPTHLPLPGTMRGRTKSEALTDLLESRFRELRLNMAAAPRRLRAPWRGDWPLDPQPLPGSEAGTRRERAGGGCAFQQGLRLSRCAQQLLPASGELWVLASHSPSWAGSPAERLPPPAPDARPPARPRLAPALTRLLRVFSPPPPALPSPLPLALPRLFSSGS